ncbi:MAG: baseplate J/gp47 family protein [Gemmatimonadota bacterium]|nr:baseplate J/gp47 family protein [Gemmatimonadota bacterium]
MTSLAPKLFDRRFADFMEIGRARIPALAPEWTDHNAHDPGITLMELLAWVAEAQLYSLSHLRRDERTAYAALLGLSSSGTRAATGTIWPDPRDPSSPARTYTRSAVIPDDALIQVEGAPTPTFAPTRKLLWIPGQIERLETVSADGRRVDQTALNERGGRAFLPFGELAGRRDVLAITFLSNDLDPLDPIRHEAQGAVWAIGVRAAPAPSVGTNPSDGTTPSRSTLAATFVHDGDRLPVPIVSDSTQGFLTTGVLLLDLTAVPSVPRFTIELRSPNGSIRPPRLLRIEPNVVPIRQGHSVVREQSVATGRPDQIITLQEPGLRFDAGAEPVAVEVTDGLTATTWARAERLSERGPDENVYELDLQRGALTFGNGINGRIPPAGSPIYVSYGVSDADRGNAARNRRWHVTGFEGAFGVNPDPVSGGAAPFAWVEQRREARRRSREDHALVSPADIESAAKALPLLEVVRAWVVPPDARAPRSGVVRLVAMRARTGLDEPVRPPETVRWLEAIRRRVAPRTPLGTRLVVTGPRYIDFSINVTIECDVGRDPAVVKANVEQTLRTRLALTDVGGATPRRPGVPVTQRDLKAWLLTTAGVRRITALELLNGESRPVPDVIVPPSGLARWIPTASSIVVNRSGAAGAASAGGAA